MIITNITRPFFLTLLIFAALIFKPAAAEEFSASFKGTDIQEFINTVSKNLNKTVIIDPSVRGTITVRSYDMLNEEQYYQFFLSVLDVYGFAVINMNNGVLKVVRSKDAKTAAVPVASDAAPGTGDEVVTRVVPLTNVAARDLAPLLRQLNDNAGAGSVVHYEPSNVLLMTGRAAVIKRLLTIVERVDNAGDRSVVTVPLSWASAADVVKLVTELNKDTSKSALPGSMVANVVADERTNAVLVSGEPNSRQRIVAMIKQLDRQQATQGNTKVIYLKYAKAADLVEVLTGISSTMQSEKQAAKPVAALDKNIIIKAHGQTNALIVTAAPDVMNDLERVIDQLDIRRPQVLVEAIIAEVQDGNGLDLGVQWTGKHGGVQFGSTGLPISQIKKSKVIGSYTGLATGFFNGDFGALMTALSTNGKNDILSTPSVVTLDNKEASFNVGQDVPVLSGSQTTSGDNVFNSVERKTVGTKLKIVPQINDGDMIHLKIEQEVSSVDNTSTADASLGPTFNTRTINNEVMVHSGQTVVLGGLMENVTKQSVSKVPLLGDIPVVGQLFRYTSQDSAKRNLMVFIHTTVLRDDDNYSAASKEKYDQIQARQQQRMEEHKLGIIENADNPILPAYPSQSHAAPVSASAPVLSRNPFKE